MPFPLAAMAIPAATGIIGGMMGNQSSTVDPADLMPSGFGFMSGEGPGQDEWKQGIQNMLQTAAQPDLDPQILQRMMAQIASGFGGAMDTSQRNAAYGVGPQQLDPYNMQISQGMAGADQQAKFAQMNDEARRRNMGMLFPLMDFWAKQSQTASQTEKPPGVMAGALQGIGTGLDMAGSMQDLGMFGGGKSKKPANGSGDQ